jgi:hypothetical protein
MSPPVRLLSAAAVLLSAVPAYACGPGPGEVYVILAIMSPFLALLASPLLLLTHDLVRLPFGWRPGRRGAIVRAVLGAGGAAVGFWGGAWSEGMLRLGLLGYGAACAVLPAWSAARARKAA